MARKSQRKSSPKAKKAPAISSRKTTSSKKPSAKKGSRKATGKSKSTTRKGTAPASKKATPASKKAPAKASAKKSAAKSPPQARGGQTRRKKKQTKAEKALLLAHSHDDLYAARLIEELEFRHGIDVSTLDIGMRDGKARVRGVVSDEDELDAVRDTISDSGGISDLEYLVQIAPNRREEDREAAQSVQEIIDTEPDLQAENIHIACLAGKIVLRGTVSNPLVKGKAGLLALRQDAASRVRNRLVVVAD